MVTSLSRNGGSRPKSLQSELIICTPTKESLNELPKTPLFGTDGIRGKAGDLLTAPFALKLGFWAGQVLQEASAISAPVIIGQDSRNSSDMLAMALAAGLTSAGLEVWQLGLCPTPCVAYLTRMSDAIGGIMISASHNPPEDNGIKFFGREGTKLSNLLTQKIEAGLRGNLARTTVENSTQWGKTYQHQDLTKNYSQFLQESLPSGIDLRGMRIVLDLAWGASVEVAPAVFRALGAEVICLHDRADGDRINVNCGSTHLNLLQAAVIETGADLGFAFDGDADRVMAVDAQGRVVDGDHILYFWGQILKDRQQLPDNALVTTVMANLGFERAWRSLGGQMLRTAVGDRYVQEKMWQTGAMLGGEQSGHIICHHHSVSGDGVQTALHLAALVRELETSLAELVDRSFQTYPQILRNVCVEDRERRTRWQECDRLQQAIARAEVEMGDLGRVLVRASGTEPLIRVMVESACAKSAQHWSDRLVSAVESYL
ncbi:phosphoglucosamine mutase [Candidatus Gracilibacteria bacterium]|nr:phosphoglucosamine mutase [Candidatus Gracilibacteria bacterium]NJM87353.1 phosphoglucosamine mutase [Hydrococcus sp. RU_2_2]NJP19838.1 phosphoglucosamine mutase [Hydrococcus sp. CRU_1_1]NJQ98209.1 phosphoglucosamine mutase [Hydrococcus sp. CSU_1_8]